MNLFSIFQVSPKQHSPYNARLGSFPRVLIPHLGDHSSWQRGEYRLSDILCMPPKYDLILRRDGKLKIKQIMAIDIKDAIGKGKLESSDLEGIVFSDQNEEAVCEQ